jgi:hypothetical protein
MAQKWSRISIPGSPTPSLVHVTGIPPDADEADVREFFASHGDLLDIEVQDAEALVIFKDDSNADKVVQEPNPKIKHKPVNIKYHFDEYNKEQEDSRSIQEDSSHSVVEDLLFYGLTITKRIIQKVQSVDRRLGASTWALGYYEQACTKLDKLDKKYKARERANSQLQKAEERFDVSGKVDQATDQARNVVGSAMETNLGQRASEFVDQVQTSAEKAYNKTVDTS